MAAHVSWRAGVLRGPAANPAGHTMGMATLLAVIVSGEDPA